MDIITIYNMKGVSCFNELMLSGELKETIAKDRRQACGSFMAGLRWLECGHTGKRTVNRRNDEKRKITEEVYDKVREDRELA